MKNNFFQCVKMAKIRAKNSSLGGFLELIGCPVVFFDLFKHWHFRGLKSGMIGNGTFTLTAG